MQKLLCVLFCCFLNVLSLTGQQDSVLIKYDKDPIKVKQLSDDDLQVYRDNPDFNYEIIKAERTWWDDFKSWLGNLFLQFFEWLFGGEKAVGYFAVFLRIIPYILLGVLVFILIKFFLNVNANRLQQAKNDKAYVSLSEEEHIIKNENIQELIRKALANKDYRLAVRYYYLYTLQLMTAQELIDWQLQKTNDDYIQELESTTLKGPFETITRLYDYIWYGNFELNEVKYLKAENAFMKLQNTLKNA